MRLVFYLFWQIHLPAESGLYLLEDVEQQEDDPESSHPVKLFSYASVKRASITRSLPMNFFIHQFS
jgi:hypothetical protein